MHIHILGICGTFMGSLAVLAKELGHRVTGSDANVYPPMSTQLEAQGIELMQGYEPAHLEPAPDLVVVGNAMSRGNPAVEYVLNKGLPYVSGPQWLADHVLQGRWVLAAAGTHGKTTTSSMLAWVLEHAGMSPGSSVVCRRTSASPHGSAVRRSSWWRPTSTTAPFRQAQQIRPLPPAHRNPEQSGVRSRGYLPGSSRHRAAVPSLSAHCPGRGVDHPSRVGNGAQTRHRNGLLDAGADHWRRRPVAGEAAQRRRLALRSDLRRRGAGRGGVGADRPAQRQQCAGDAGGGTACRRAAEAGRRGAERIP